MQIARQVLIKKYCSLLCINMHCLPPIEGKFNTILLISWYFIHSCSYFSLYYMQTKKRSKDVVQADRNFNKCRNVQEVHVHACIFLCKKDIHVLPILFSKHSDYWSQQNYMLNKLNTSMWAPPLSTNFCSFIPEHKLLRNLLM